MNKRKIYVLSLISTLVLILSYGIVSSNEKYDNKDYRAMREDADLGMELLDDLVKFPPISFERLDEIGRIAERKNSFYINFKSDDKIETKIAMSLATGFSMTNRALKEYKYNKKEAENDYYQARKEFCYILRMLNQLSLNKNIL